ncbi:dihydropyrimidinase [uncultured Cetobacterium sp.]|uniref:dihydropyrimidinase n=1 Tax=uncultured Cetobacterium sp. TaxID=527638 RepID=UPI0025D37F0F|nr:dihydropyrimidinase [uncultured Cetobacterium sp.]
MKILLRNGFILTENGLEKKDILIDGQFIKNIDKNIVIDSQTTLYDFTDKFIIPGGIDVHTHFDIDVGSKSSVDNFYSGGIAALAGGTTTIIDHPGFGPQNCKLDFQINKYLKLAQDCPIDYSFHGVLQSTSENLEVEMSQLKENGISSFKLYMTYSYMMSDEDILKVFTIAKKLDVVICVHAENHAMIEHLKSSFKERNLTTPIYHSKSRPDYTESEAVNRLLLLAECTHFEKLYFVHISCKKSLEILNSFKKKGKNFFIETCPQYLLLSEDEFLKEDGYKFILSPPLRKKEDNISIKKYLNDELIDVIATDHCSFSLNDKKLGKENFLNCPNGIPGVEERIPLMFTEFLKGNITSKVFLNSCCINPAKIFGLYPQKGTLKIGSDADITVLSVEDFNFDSTKSKANYSVFKNHKSLVKVDTVFIRGTLLLKNEAFFNENHKGNFLKRN